MPLPSPKAKEKRADFVSRCIGDNTTTKDFPDQKQRIAVCYSQWDRAKKASGAVIGSGDNEVLIEAAQKINANGGEEIQESGEEYIEQAKQIIRELLNAANKVSACLNSDECPDGVIEPWVFEKMVLSKAMICSVANYLEFGVSETETDEKEEETSETSEEEKGENTGLIEPESAKVISKDYIREKVYNNKWGAPTY
jgi:hypothetical protein